MEQVIQRYNDLRSQFGGIVDLLGALFVSLLFFLVFLVLYRYTKKYLQRYQIESIPILKKYIYKPGIYLFISLGLLIAHELFAWESGIAAALTQILKILLILTSSFFLIRVIVAIKEFMVGKYDINIESNLRARKVHTQYRIIERMLKFLIIILAIGFVLMTFDAIRRVGVSLLASAGLAGVIIGFAAQKSIATIIAGIQIAFTQPIRIQDVVIVEGEWGRIEEITLTYVVVNIWDQRRLIVPITYFIDNPFQNWTRTNSELLGTIFLHLDYEVNTDGMRQQLQEIVREHPLWDGRVALVQVTDTTEKNMVVRLLVSGPNSGDLWDLRCDVREQMLKWLQQNYPESLPKNRLILLEKELAQKGIESYPVNKGY